MTMLREGMGVFVGATIAFMVGLGGVIAFVWSNDRVRRAHERQYAPITRRQMLFGIIAIAPASLLFGLLLSRLAEFGSARAEKFPPLLAPTAAWVIAGLVAILPVFIWAGYWVWWRAGLTEERQDELDAGAGLRFGWIRNRPPGARPRFLGGLLGIFLAVGLVALVFPALYQLPCVELQGRASEELGLSSDLVCWDQPPGR